MKLFVGIDVSLKDFKARIFDAEGEEVAKRIRCKNDDPGAENFVKYLVEICEAKDVDCLRIGLEATSVYGWHLQMHLAGEPAFIPFHPPQVHVINPKVVHNFRKQYIDAPKDDWFDCLVIADRLRFGRLSESCQVDFRYLPLQRLTRFRHHLMQTITREKIYFLSNLFFKFNTICQDKVLSNNFGAASEAILTEFLSPEEIAARPLDELIDILMEKGRSHFADPMGSLISALFDHNAELVAVFQAHDSEKCLYRNSWHVIVALISQPGTFRFAVCFATPTAQRPGLDWGFLPTICGRWPA